MDLAINNQQRLICHQIQPINQPTKSTTDRLTKSIRLIIDSSNKMEVAPELNMKK